MIFPYPLSTHIEPLLELLQYTFGRVEVQLSSFSFVLYISCSAVNGHQTSFVVIDQGKPLQQLARVEAARVIATAFAIARLEFY